MAETGLCHDTVPTATVNSTPNQSLQLEQGFGAKLEPGYVGRDWTKVKDDADVDRNEVKRQNSDNRLTCRQDKRRGARDTSVKLVLVSVLI